MGWLEVDPGNVSSRGMGSLSPSLLRNALQQHSPDQHSPAMALGAVLDFWVVLHSSVGSFAKSRVGLCFLIHPIIPATTNFSLVPALPHQVSIYCQWSWQLKDRIHLFSIHILLTYRVHIMKCVSCEYCYFKTQISVNLPGFLYTYFFLPFFLVYLSGQCLVNSFGFLELTNPFSSVIQLSLSSRKKVRIVHT